MVEYNFGNRLKELRTKAGLTQQKLGGLLRVSKSMVSYYELQERTPSPEVLVKLASIFHVSADYLLGIEKSKSVDVTGLSDTEVKVIEDMINALRSP